MKRLLAFLTAITFTACVYPQSMNVTVQPTGSGTGTFNNPQISYYLAATGQTWDFRNATVYLPASFTSGVSQIVAGTGISISPSGGTGIVTINSSGGGGTGTVTAVSTGNLSPLFTTSVANSTTTPTISFTAGSQAGSTIYGNSSYSSQVPAFSSVSSYLDSLGSYSVGSILYRGSSAWIPLAPSTVGYVLQTLGTGYAPGWAAVTNSITGTANQVLVNSTTGSPVTGIVTLTTPQNIDTLAQFQVSALGIGAAASNTFAGINNRISITGNAYGIYNGFNPTIGANNQVEVGFYSKGNLYNPSSYTGATYYAIDLSTPSLGTNYNTTAQLYIEQSAASTNHYGIYQSGTDANSFAGNITTPNLTLTSGGGGRITFADGTTQTTAASGSGGGVTSLTGTTNQVIVSASTGNVTLSLPQSIATTSNPQFAHLGLGTASGSSAGVLSYPSVADAGSGQSWGFYNRPLFTASVNGDILYGNYIYPDITAGSYTGVKYYGSYLDTPSFSGTIAYAAQLYIAADPTATTKYGIYQAGTDANVLSGSLTVPAFTATGTTTLATSLTGILKATSGVVSTATSGTDYAPATSGTSLLYGNGSGGFSNATVSSTNLTFSSGTLNTIQNIATTSSPQFSSLGVGVAASGTAGDLYANSNLEVGVAYSSIVGINFQPSTTSTGTGAKALRLSPTLTAGVNADTLYNLIEGGTVATVTYTGLNYHETNLGVPTFTGTGTVTNAYQLYLSGFGSPAVTVTNKYGIYQAGTEQNYFAGALNVASGSRGATNQNLTPGTSTVTSGASPSVNWSLSNSFDLTLTSATAASMAFTNAVDGQVITIAIHQPASGTPTTVSWSGITGILWAGGTAPTQTATLSKTDVYTFYYNATAAKYYGSYVQNF